MKTKINWKVFFTLWVATTLASIAVLPYTLELQSALLASIDLPMSLTALIAIQILQTAIMFGILILIGMFLANRIGLGLPLLDAWTRGESIADRLRRLLPISIILGVVGGVLIIVLDVFVFQPALLQELGDKANALYTGTAQPAAWKGFLASFYGGIAEEVLLRLFAMTLLAWLGSFISKNVDGTPTNAVIWIANITAAVLFGLGHLPVTSTLIPITTIVVIRAIVLNGLVGVVAGYLYWKRGLESAMVTHFSADIVLHVLLAL